MLRPGSDFLAGGSTMKRLLLLVLLFCAAGLLAQDVPAGTILPLQLNSSLNPRKSRNGQRITARIMQDVPLPNGEKIPAGAKVIGHVTNVIPANSASGGRISVRFDTLTFDGRRIPIATNLRAIASMLAVHDAQIPDAGPDRGTPESVWNTNQIGDEVVYRGGGPVANGLVTVGQPVPDGVLVHISARPGSPCRGETESNDRLQALWVFSSDACGAYELEGLTIVHAGRTNPVGEITLAFDKGDVNVRAGSGLLLSVNRAQ
jgi:hypothetical protein